MNVLIALIALTASGLAETEAPAFSRRALASRAVFDVRLAASTVPGGATSEEGPRPYLCFAGAPHARLILEGCGNGSGLFHNADAPELAHFRALGVLTTLERGRTDVSVLAGAGLAELQVAADEPGFKTRNTPAEGQVEAAGPEVSAAIKARIWTTPGTYVVGELNGGAAHIPASPTITGEGGPVVPFGTVSLGMGF